MKKFMTNKLVVVIPLILVMCILVFVIVKAKTNKEKDNRSDSYTAETIISSQENNENINDEENTNKNVKIVDINSKKRPYAISVNNTPIAVQVQTGLNKAYLVYEIPTEGNTSRLLALYKTAEDITVGTIRSARKNFIDYALESNAIFVHYGWCQYSEQDEKSGIIDYINGLFGGPFWRNNPENLASEHTAYTSTKKISEEIQNKSIKADAETSEETMVLKYSSEELVLSDKPESKPATKIVIPYGSAQNVTSFVYDENAKMYNRQENGNNCIDHETKEQVSTKNIIVQKITYGMCEDNYRWDLHTVGSGEGYFITNGYAVPIKWSKKDRSSKTVYTYQDGKELNVNDGRTYIEIQTTSQILTIE